MCGRFALFTPPARLAELFDAVLDPDVDPEGRPRWNIGPTSRVLGLVPGATPTAGRSLGRFRWGLVPQWAKDPAIGNRLFNARGETVAVKPSFRSAFAHRRMAVVADGFFEWQKGPDGTRTPYYFHRADGDPLAFAGLWEPPAGAAVGDEGPAARTCTIVTTAAGPDMAGIHDRMPVVLDAADIGRWTDPAGADREELEALLRPAAAGTLDHYPVDRRVGSVRNDGPDIIAPIDHPTR